MSSRVPTSRYRLEEQIGYVLRRAHQRASDVFAREMASFDVTPVQFSTLVRLSQTGEMSRGELCRSVAMDPATAVGVVRRLAARGLVEQRTDPEDGRRLRIALTRDGRREAERMMASAFEVSRRTLAPLDGSQCKVLLSLLEKLAEGD